MGRNETPDASGCCSVLHDLFGQPMEVAANVRSVAVAKLSSLDHQNVDGLRFGIDPALRPKRAAVAERSRRDLFGNALRFTDNAPSESPSVPWSKAGDEFSGLNRCHLLDGRSRNDSLSIKFAAVENHLIEPRHVGHIDNTAAIAANRWYIVISRFLVIFPTPSSQRPPRLGREPLPFLRTTSITRRTYTPHLALLHLALDTLFSEAEP